MTDETIPRKTECSIYCIATDKRGYRNFKAFLTRSLPYSDLNSTVTFLSLFKDQGHTGNQDII